MTQPASQNPIRVLIIPDKYYPDNCGGGAIYTDMCRGLASRGLAVTVRCPYPFYPEWTDKSGRNGFKIDRNVEPEGVTVEHHGFFIPKNPRSAWQRILLDASFLASLSRSLFRGKFDAVIAFSPHLGGVAFAGLHKLLYRRPLWLNVQDLPADAASASGITRLGWFQKLLAQIQKTLFNRADVWSSISPVMINRLEAIRQRDQPILFLANWLNQSMADEIRRHPDKVGRPVGQPPRLLYAGNIGAKQGLLDFCKSLQTSTVDFDFRIHGDGGVAAEVRDWVASVGDRRFSFGPLFSEAGFIEALHQTDLFVITEKSGSGASFFPSKVAPGLSSSTPLLVISDSDSPLGREVRTQNVGPCFDWEECGAVPELLASLASRQDEFTTWQRNAVRRGQFYDREGCLDLIEQTLQKMTQAQTVSSTVAAAPVLSPSTPTG